MAQRLRRFKDRLREDSRDAVFRRHYMAYDLPVRLALQIAHLRRLREMTQAQLAGKIGVSQQFVARLENSEKTIPSLRTLEKVAQALDKSLYIDFR